jgi:hypothetical protein
METKYKVELIATKTEHGEEFKIDSNTDMPTTSALAMAAACHCLRKEGLPEARIARMFQLTAMTILANAGLMNKEDGENGKGN